MIMMECLEGKSLNEYENNNIKHYKFLILMIAHL